jgi:cytidyltransferase-like protein
MRIAPKTKIMVFGTFDILHKGHLNFFKQARKLSRNPFLIVSVARDINVKKIKGVFSIKKEKQRLAEIKKCLLVDRATLGGVKNYIAHIKKQSPQIIALGYDQKAYVKNLKADLKTAGINAKIVRLKAFYPKVYKSSFLKAQKDN